ncbi:MAG: FapA family protein [Candidatus Sericytochromatia bacterium]|nr:FapA family protein [Candidatus Sericytochromatia bacterium]
MQIEVARSLDELTATLILPNGLQPTEAALRMALADAGIVHGILEDVLQQLALEAEPGEHVIARGQPAIPGESGRIEALVEIQPETLVPRQLEDGSVDHFNLGASPSVAKGALIARRLPPIPGTPGRTVGGGWLVVPPVEEAEFKAGKGCEISADGNSLVSTVQGLVRETQGTWTVEPVFRVPGDVDFHTGHIDFDGDVHIDGHVAHHFRVVATGDIVVRGSVDGGHLVAGRHIRVGEGVFQEATLQAGGDIKVTLLDHATATARGGIAIQEDAVFATMTAQTSILVQGTLVGGRSEADGALVVAKLGGKQGTPTAVSLSPKERWGRIRDEARATQERHEGNRQRILEGLQQMEAMRVRFKGLHPDKEVLVARLKETLEAIAVDHRKLEETVREAESHINHAHDPVLKISEILRPGVAIWLQGQGMTTKESTGPCTVRIHEGRIRIVEGKPQGS